MLTVFGPGGDILLITGDVVLRRNQAEKGLERGVVSFERSLQFCRRDHFASTPAEAGRERGAWVSAV